ncbi:MAG TPA: S9 family peptidase [Pyrinomonadaceae bacterium]|jgi:dipeptidyl aminopeptidase/acylaminoacyl peptidase|nr:S9 family peptidase [Pyrinomonadaceae bacterium]
MRISLKSYGTLLALILFIASPVVAQPQQSAATRRGVTPEDYYAFEFLREPRISPDGKLVAYVLTTIDRKQNRRNSSIWLATTDGTRAPWQFTTSPQSSTSPQWSPDGQSLAFLSSRPTATDGATQTEGAGSSNRPKNQIYILSMSGGEARRVTDLKNGVDGFQWSPDGTRFAVLSRVGPSDNRPENKERSDVRHYSYQQYKFNDTGWFDDKRTHIWVVDVKTGKATQITQGDDWDDRDPQWSPDGTRIAFVSDRTGRAYEDSRNTEVWVIPAEGGTLLKISDHAESDNTPRWSPDGKTIAFIGQTEERAHAKIWLAPSAGGVPSVLAAKDLDLIPSDLEWSADGRALYFNAGARGEYQLFRVSLGSKEAKAITSGPRAVRNMDLSPRAGRMVYTVNDFKHMDDIYVADINARNERRLTNLNETLWKQLQLQDVERFTYKGADGWDIDGFFVRPVGWQEGRKYPMILNIHGGPAGQYGVDWFHEFQVYAARGWAVFFTNPRGSTGYGQKFERGIEGEWGGKDYIDIMNGVEAALQKYPWLDRNRLGVTGGSYGGYMTNWIVSHTDMFKAAVTLRSVSNFISDEGTRDFAYGHKPDFGGDLFEKFDLYWERSPLRYAKNVKTPTLILHADNDLRVPLEQGEQWYRALKHYGVTTELVVFPRDNHNLTRTGEPRHLVESLNWQLYWFDRFIEGNAAAVPPSKK